MGSIMTVRAPEDLQDILSAQAKSLGLARNALILQILWEWVGSHQQGIPVEKKLLVDKTALGDVKISSYEDV